MATTLEDLERRLELLEREVTRLRDCVAPPPGATDAELGARLLRQAKANQPALSAAWDKWFAEMGITAKPIGAEELQKLFLAAGHDPTDNSYSQGILAMREE
jgi:hypothetical protein